jgi:predicted kinase
MELPTKRQEVTDYNPALMVLFGKPKSGKSTLMAALNDNLILDLEDGYRSLPVMRVKIRNAKDLLDVKREIIKKAKELGKLPYKYITIDNATRLEEFALPVAADL